MEQTKSKSTVKTLLAAVLTFVVTLVMLFSLVPGMSLTAYAADEVSENISLVNGQSLVLGTHYSVSGEFENESGIHVYNKDPMTINARKGETITKVVLTYSWGNNKSSLSASAGTFDGNATISDINAQQVTISSSNTAGVKISAVTVYFEGSLSNPTVTLTGGANAKSSGGLLTQSYLPGAMDTVTYTALTGATFPAFENFTQNGVTVERTSDTVVTVSGTPTANTEITVPDAESSSKIVTWDSSIINASGRNGIGNQIDMNNSYSDTANGITLTKSGSGYASLDYGDWMTSGDVTLNFTTATGKFTSIEIETSQIYDGGNWTKDGNTLKWNGTPSNSVSLSGSRLYLEGVSSINFVIEMPTVSVTITAGDHMTKTTDSGEASQSDLSGAMTDVVYTADDGYYFPEDYSVAAVNGISVTRNSYTQITVSGTPTADATITLTAPTAKTTPDAPTTATATDCTTADNNDGKLTGVTTAMEYKKSDAENWTAGTGSDITGLVLGTYYVRVKATDTTNASTNQELTIKGFISYTVTFKVVNGSWDEGEGDAATADKTVTLTGHDGDILKLTADQIPAVGTKPNDTYKAGSWNVTPSADTEITAATTYTYTYARKDSISRTVTFKVVNGSWNDETTTDKTVTLTGYEGDTLKLAADQIPTVGTKPNDTYKAGSWDVMPNTDTAITEATTYTYTYVAKEASVVTKAPEAKTLTYNGQAQELVTAGTATGGEMQYALGTETEATQPYTTSIPTGTEAGTYYVWYKVAGDENHNDTNPAFVEVIINKATPSYTAPTDLVATYGDTLSSISLPTGWAWADGTASVGNAGTNTFKANFTPADTANYNTVNNVDVTVTVVKADPTYTIPSGLTATYGDTLSSVTLPEGWTWTEPTTSVGTVGSHAFAATFTPDDTDNYNTVEQNLTVTVNANDKTALIAAIGSASEYYNSISSEHPDIAATLQNAIDVATSVKNDDNKTEEEISDAVTALNGAVDQAKADENQAKASIVKARIDAIGTVGLTVNSKALIDLARESYDGLTTDQKALVSNYDVLTAAEVRYADLGAADEAKTLIDAIGDVAYSTESKGKIDAARAAYNALTPEQQALVPNYETLTSAEGNYTDLKVAKEAEDAINALPASDDITINDKANVQAAQAKYDALTPTQKEIVSAAVVAKLAAAGNMVAAQEVIVSIGTIDASNPDSEKVAEARAAYDALTDEQKAKVTNYESLTAAESKLIEINNPEKKGLSGGAIAGIVIAFVVVLGALGALLFSYFKQRKNEKK